MSDVSDVIVVIVCVDVSDLIDAIVVIDVSDVMRCGYY